MEKLDIDISYRNDGSLTTDLGSIIEQAKSVAYRAVDTVLVYRNWLLGKRIAEEELRGDVRAAYGRSQLSNLANALTEKYGRDFDALNLTGWLIDGRNHDSGTRCCSFSRLRRRAVGVRPVNQPPS